MKPPSCFPERVLVLVTRAIGSRHPRGAARQRRHGDALVRETLTHIRELHDKFAFVHAQVRLPRAALNGARAWRANLEVGTESRSHKQPRGLALRRSPRAGSHKRIPRPPGDERWAAVSERCAAKRPRALGEAGPWFLMLTLYVRAILAVRRGSLDEALGFVRESLTRVRDLHDKFAFIYALVPLAAVAELKGDDAWAARILGARDVVAERTGAAVVDKSVHDLTEQAGREVRARLGPDRWAQAYAVGRMSSIDALLKDVDRALGQTA
jgi:hypothetical protein